MKIIDKISAVFGIVFCCGIIFAMIMMCYHLYYAKDMVLDCITNFCGGTS